MIIGFLRVRVHIPLCNSLKEKRSVIKKHLHRLRKNYNIGISEIDDLDLWQSCQIGVVTIGSLKESIDKTLRAVLKDLETSSDIQVMDFKTEYI